MFLFLWQLWEQGGGSGGVATGYTGPTLVLSDATLTIPGGKRATLKASS